MPLDDAILLAAVRAGRRTGTPAGLLSALRAAQLLLGRYAEPEQPEPDGPWESSPAPLRVAAGECWCGHCGEVVVTARAIAGARVSDELIACCRQTQPVPVTTILQPEEYYVR